VSDDCRQFLYRLLATPGVSGDEQRVQAVVQQYASGFCDLVEFDLHGNLTLAINPGSTFRVMLAGHADQIGLLVSQIDDQGFVNFQTVGGWDPQQLIGQRVQVWSAKGCVPGVISRKPIHLLEESERNTVVKFTDMWIDIGATDQEQSRQLVQVGDPVTLQMGHQELRGGAITAVALDNRTGVWTVVEALRRAKLKGAQVGVFAVSTVAEEIGLRGATTSAERIRPQVGIAVDVTHATDCPSIDRRQLGQVSLGQGPVVFRGPNMNPEVVRRFRETAAQSGHKYQLAALGRAASNDSNAIQISGHGVATGLVAIPNRYMHSAVEVCHWNDLDTAADLLADFCVSLNEADSFIPMPPSDNG
jgi:tetrahedral aminopeptidase